MTGTIVPVFVIPGAGGGAPDSALFSRERDDRARFVTIGYPGWRRYVDEEFSGDVLVGLLADRIASRLPHGPICILGVSLGAHFGYAVALRLQAMGRDIAGFCAIDSAMISSPARSARWKERILARGIDLLQRRHVGEFVTYFRGLGWRAVFRLAGGRLPDRVRRFAGSGRLPWIAAVDAKFEEELSMRLLIVRTATWIGSLDRAPAPLDAPAVLLRTAATAAGDAAWRRRCPAIEVVQIRGSHETLFEAENADSFRAAFVDATRRWPRHRDGTPSRLGRVTGTPQ